MSGSGGTSFVKRQINATFSLGTGAFGNGPANTVTVSGLRATASIVVAGGVSMGSADLRIYGLPLSTMNQLSTLGQVPNGQPKNQVTIEAGDNVSGMHQIFQGAIIDGYFDGQAMPETAFVCSARMGMLQAMQPVTPTSYKGSVDATTVMAGLAQKMGLEFQNNGVSVQLSNPYFWGAARQQAETCAQAGDFQWVIDGNTLAIWPHGQPRSGVAVDVSPATGMIGYPTFSSFGSSGTTLFNPAIVYGTQLNVTSALKPACGKWIVYTLAHDLEAETPGGTWETHLEATPPGYVPVTE